MKDWIHKLSQFTSAVDSVVDEVRGQVAYTLGIEDPIRILPYRGYGTLDNLLVKGRVLKDEGIKLKEEGASVFENLCNMYKRFATDEVPNALLKVRLDTIEKEVVTDKEGFFNLEVQLNERLAEPIEWCPVDISLINPEPDGNAVLGQAEVLIVGERASFGVISDIDDTIVHTAATDLLKMIKIVYLGNAESRKPFDQVAEFYQALQQGKKEGKTNPIFYVSSSAWNMYDVFVRFMELNGIPKGPIFLKDVELSLEKIFAFKHEVHKLEQIEPIFKRFPHLPFLLIGDSGQKDPEIYTTLIEQYPDQILGIMIRDVVPGNAQRRHEIEQLTAKIATYGCELFMFKETREAIAYATRQGWVAA
ncbi:MAG: phosphatase domain-containing protein [Cyanobacteria bacterium J06638_28]